ncbi:MAG: hypothetical protein ACKVOB_04060 [Sphingomonas sp.]
MAAPLPAFAIVLLASAPLAVAAAQSTAPTPPAASQVAPAPPPSPAAPAAPQASSAPPAPAAPEAPEAPAADSSPLDLVLMSAHPLAFPAKGNIAKVTKSHTENCVVTISLEDGRTVAIDLKSATNLSTNTSLMVHQKSSGVQFEFDGKGGAADAAKADKALTELADKCS